jgi:hypothetical protein
MALVCHKQNLVCHNDKFGSIIALFEMRCVGFESFARFLIQTHKIIIVDF